MKRSTYKTILAIAVIGLVFSGCAFADGVPTASIQPASSTASIGHTVVVDVNVSSIADLSAFQFDISFNPAILSAQSVSEGAFLPSGGSTFFIPGTIDNVGGTIAFNADTLTGPIPGVSGTGVLAAIDFLAIGSGISPIDLANTIFLDSTGANISVSLENGAVDVTSAVATPEPPTVALILAGIVAGFWLARNRPGLIPV